MTNKLNFKNGSLKYLQNFVALYFLLMFVFSTTIIGVQMIPRSSIENNIKSSAEELEEEGMYPIVGWSNNHILDTFTDAIILNMLYVANSDEPLKSGMLNYLKYQPQDTPINILHKLMNNDGESPEAVSYSRYWHGLQIIVRPLLVFTDYDGIIILNIAFILILLFLLSVFMWKKISPIYAISFFLTFSLTNSFIMPLNIQYMSCISIAMIGMITIMLFPGIVDTMYKSSLYFFSVGSICCFFDLLTFPIITFGLPFIVLFSTQEYKSPIKVLLLTGCAWAIGYGLSFVSKWTIATLLTQQNCFDSAFESFSTRISIGGFDLIGCTKSIVYLNIVLIRELWFFIIPPYFILFFTKRKELVQCIRQYYWLLLVAAIVPAWYLSVRNHSFVHWGFTWRTSFLSVYSILLFAYLTTYNIWFQKVKSTKLNILL